MDEQPTIQDKDLLILDTYLMNDTGVFVSHKAIANFDIEVVTQSNVWSPQQKWIWMQRTLSVLKFAHHYFRAVHKFAHFEFAQLTENYSRNFKFAHRKIDLVALFLGKMRIFKVKTCLKGTYINFSYFFRLNMFKDTQIPTLPILCRPHLHLIRLYPFLNRFIWQYWRIGNKKNKKKCFWLFNGLI